MAQFVLKIEKLSYIIDTASILEMARAYGLRLRLWLLFLFSIWRGDYKIFGFAIQFAGCVWTGALSGKKNWLADSKNPNMCGRGLREPPTALCHPTWRANHEPTEHFLHGTFFAVCGHLLCVTIGPLDCHCDWQKGWGEFHLLIINFSRQSIETKLIC